MGLGVWILTWPLVAVVYPKPFLFGSGVEPAAESATGVEVGGVACYQEHWDLSAQTGC